MVRERSLDRPCQLDLYWTSCYFYLCFYLFYFCNKIILYNKSRYFIKKRQYQSISGTVPAQIRVGNHDLNRFSCTIFFLNRARFYASTISLVWPIRYCQTKVQQLIHELVYIFYWIITCYIFYIQYVTGLYKQYGPYGLVIIVLVVFVFFHFLSSHEFFFLCLLEGLFFFDCWIFNLCNFCTDFKLRLKLWWSWWRVIISIILKL